MTTVFSLAELFHLLTRFIRPHIAANYMQSYDCKLIKNIEHV